MTKYNFTHLLSVVHVYSSNQKDDQDDWQDDGQCNILTQHLVGGL